MTAIVRKGMDPERDSYSGFRDNLGPDGERRSTGLAGLLRDRGVEAVYLAGLARDVCVKWTAQDAVAEGFETHLIWDLSRSVEPKSDDALRDSLMERGVKVTTSDRVVCLD